nr:MAG TPA: hypothetical protein [Inoviridae sp.]
MFQGITSWFLLTSFTLISCAFFRSSCSSSSVTLKFLAISSLFVDNAGILSFVICGFMYLCLNVFIH